VVKFAMLTCSGMTLQKQLVAMARSAMTLTHRLTSYWLMLIFIFTLMAGQQWLWKKQTCQLKTMSLLDGKMYISWLG